MAAEKSLEHELIRSGKIENDSGELLVIDPCYLIKFDETLDKLKEKITSEICIDNKKVLNLKI